MRKFKKLVYFIFILIPISVNFADEAPEDFDKIRKSVVQIRVFSQSGDAFAPWNPGPISGSGGTGFIIDKDRILTNAHVVSSAKFIQIQRYNQTEWYEAKLSFIAHDCDLAILEAVAPKFYEESSSLEFGEIPELNTPVMVVGFPIGGSKVSVSRGIVSRKEQAVYAHSQVDSHLVIQVDAAINPGNSGGPAIQNGKVVGVAFQVASKGENIGYIIPTTVVNHFLKDIEDGKYDGYVELGIHTVNSFSNSLRKFRSIPSDLDGVFVSKVLYNGSAYGYLKERDLLLSIDGNPIARNGTVILDRDTRIDFVEIVDNKFAGENIEFEVYRDGKKIKTSFPAKKMLDFEYMRNSYDDSFDYVMIGGLVFQEVNRNLVSAWGRSSNTSGGSQLLYRFYHFIEDGWNQSKKADVVFYRKLDHPVNANAEYFQNLILEKVNGKPINSLSDLKDIISSSKDPFLRMEFMDIEFPLIINLPEARKAEKSIKRIYNVN
ncbi:trypsin-like peptidase domain-containing protein [Leptospira sp. GIMC2001]|nr:S1C family serine protease [Leptospira sp. GIMC2001]WCL47565.1 trypsin-like peptidase domain-containing protein [Leptospira sp. GIMC2001]